VANNWLVIPWTIAAASWLWATIHYAPWWLSRFSRSGQIQMSPERLKPIVLGYSVFVVVVVLTLGIAMTNPAFR